jgi:hypothetical protein
LKKIQEKTKIFKKKNPKKPILRKPTKKPEINKNEQDRNKILKRYRKF